MKKLNYTSEETFVTEEVLFEEEQIEIMEDIKNFIYNRLKGNLYTPTDVVVCEDKKSLAFGINTSKERGIESDNHRYAIKLTKL